MLGKWQQTSLPHKDNRGATDIIIRIPVQLMINMHEVGTGFGVSGLTWSA